MQQRDSIMADVVAMGIYKWLRISLASFYTRRLLRQKLVGEGLTSLDPLDDTTKLRRCQYKILTDWIFMLYVLNERFMRGFYIKSSPLSGLQTSCGCAMRIGYYWLRNGHIFNVWWCWFVAVDSYYPYTLHGRFTIAINYYQFSLTLPGNLIMQWHRDWQADSEWHCQWQWQWEIWKRLYSLV